MKFNEIAGGIVVLALAHGVFTGWLFKLFADVVAFYFLNEVTILRFAVLCVGAWWLYKMFLWTPVNYLLELYPCILSLKDSKTPHHRRIYDWFENEWITVSRHAYVDSDKTIRSLGVWFKSLRPEMIVIPKELFVLFDANAITPHFTQSRVLVEGNSFELVCTDFQVNNLRELNFAVRGVSDLSQEVLAKLKRGEVDLDELVKQGLIGGIRPDVAKPPMVQPDFGKR